MSRSSEPSFKTILKIYFSLYFFLKKLILPTTEEGLLGTNILGVAEKEGAILNQLKIEVLSNYHPMVALDPLL
jgi:hypothetical protein